jgi:hypothetical protein
MQHFTDYITQSEILGFNGFLDFLHRPVCKRTLKNTTFRKLDLFPASGEGWGTPTLLGPLERANLNQIFRPVVFYNVL